MSHQILWPLCPGTTLPFFRFFCPPSIDYRFSGRVFCPKAVLVKWYWSYAFISNPRCEICSENAELWIGNVFSTALKCGWQYNFKMDAMIKSRTCTLLPWHFWLQFCMYRNTLEGKFSVDFISWWTLLVTSNKRSICCPGTLSWVGWELSQCNI